MLSDYLNQAAQLQAAERNADGAAVMDNRGTISYLPPVAIPCRKRLSAREIITPEQQVIKANWIYYLAAPVQIDDLLDGKRVQLLFEWLDLGGQVMGYKAVI